MLAIGACDVQPRRLCSTTASRWRLDTRGLLTVQVTSDDRSLARATRTGLAMDNDVKRGVIGTDGTNDDAVPIRLSEVLRDARSDLIGLGVFYAGTHSAGATTPTAGRNQ